MRHSIIQFDDKKKKNDGKNQRTHIFFFEYLLLYILFCIGRRKASSVRYCVRLIGVYGQLMSNSLILRWTKTILEDEKARRFRLQTC